MDKLNSFVTKARLTAVTTIQSANKTLTSPTSAKSSNDKLSNNDKPLYSANASANPKSLLIKTSETSNYITTPKSNSESIPVTQLSQSELINLVQKFQRKHLNYQNQLSEFKNRIQELEERNESLNNIIQNGVPNQSMSQLNEYKNQLRIKNSQIQDLQEQLYESKTKIAYNQSTTINACSKANLDEVLSVDPLQLISNLIVSYSYCHARSPSHNDENIENKNFENESTINVNNIHPASIGTKHKCYSDQTDLSNNNVLNSNSDKQNVINNNPMNNIIYSLKSQIEDQNNEMIKLKENLKNAELKHNETVILTLNNDINSQSTIIKSLRNECDEYKYKLSKLQIQLKEINDTQNELMKSIQLKNSEIESLKIKNNQFEHQLKQGQNSNSNDNIENQKFRENSESGTDVDNSSISKQIYDKLISELELTNSEFLEFKKRSTNDLILAESQKSQYEQEIELLKNDKLSHQKIISELNSKFDLLNKAFDNDQLENSNYISILEKQNKENENKIIELNSQLSDVNAKLHENNGIISECNTLRRQLKSNSDKLIEYENEINFLKQSHLRETQNQIENSEIKHQNLIVRCENQELKLNENKSIIQRLNSQIEQLMNEIQNLKLIKENESKNDKIFINSLKSDNLKLENENSNSLNKIENLQNNLNELSTKYQSEISNLKTKLNPQISIQNEELRKQQSILNRQISILTSRLNHSHQQLKQFKNELLKLNSNNFENSLMNLSNLFQLKNNNDNSNNVWNDKFNVEKVSENLIDEQTINSMIYSNTPDNSALQTIHSAIEHSNSIKLLNFNAGNTSRDIVSKNDLNENSLNYNYPNLRQKSISNSKLSNSNTLLNDDNESNKFGITEANITSTISNNNNSNNSLNIDKISFNSNSENSLIELAHYQARREETIRILQTENKELTKQLIELKNYLTEIQSDYQDIKNKQTSKLINKQKQININNDNYINAQSQINIEYLKTILIQFLLIDLNKLNDRLILLSVFAKILNFDKTEIEKLKSFFEKQANQSTFGQTQKIMKSLFK